MKRYFTYIMASKYNGTIYIGITSNLVKRVHEHKSKTVPGFTQKHSVHNLVFFEEHLDIRSALAREKQLKSWKRSWKIQLIEKDNSKWKDLYQEIL